MQPFSAELLRSALADLAERLRRRDAHARLYVIGGAAMILAHNAPHATRDIDVAIEGDYDAVMDAVLGIARERGWPTTWLNEQATPYMPPADKRHRGVVVYDHPHLTVVAASATQMLAMKARAARRTDIQDVRRLVKITGVDTVEGIEELITAAFPSKSLGDRQRQWLGAVLDDAPT